ncbi:CASP8-associated protein 2 [Centropristis striata]|uniref:CASP8-associated protein 2 n=1 Tax=Centropristis striata TaxID=184440 RepID=UPI0027E0F570|nr:CASP8-associated protein 2 [Centropristis striata]
MEKIDTNNASGLLVPDVTEDSMDIYDGLDDNFSSNAVLVTDVHEDSVDIYDGLDIGSSNNAAGKSSPKASQKDSMDLYEEIVAEEQQSRESSYSELKSRFQAAQNQIKELHKRLEQMETQTTRLNTENCKLKKNISALLRTARQEVTRKDAEIQRLNQRSDKNCHHPQFHNNLQDQNSSSLRSTGRPMTRPPPPPPPPSIPLPPPPSSPPPPLPPLPPSPPKEDHPFIKPPQPSRRESNSSNYQPSGSIRKLRSSSSSRHSESGKHKVKHSEEKRPSQKLSESTDRRHRDGSDPNKDCNASDKNRYHKADKDTGQRYDSRSCNNKNYLNFEGHHRSERAKSPPLETAVSSDDKKKRSRERRQDTAHMSISDSEHSAANSLKEVSRDHRKINNSDGYDRREKDRKKSSSNQHAERRSESSKERRGDRLSKDYQRKEDRRHEEEIGRKHKRSTASESSREREKANSKVSDQGKVDVILKDREEKACEAVKTSSEKTDITVTSSVEDNSPNRKLCFMETLNLTLSPIKKPALPFDAGQSNLPTEEKVADDGPDDESSQPDVEDMCVIDEVNSSELEDVTEQASDTPKTQCSENMHKRSEHVKDVQETKQCETPAADEQLEDKLVQTTSAHSQHPGTAENQLAPTSTEFSSLKETDISRNHEDKTKQPSDSQIADSGPTDGDSDASGSISKKHTGNSSQKVNPGNNTTEPVGFANSAVLNSNVELKCRTPKTVVQKSLPVKSVDKGAATSASRGNPVAENVPDKANGESQLIAASILPQNCQQGLCPPASIAIPKKDACFMQNSPKDAEAVSSSISLESLPQEGLSLAEAIYVLTQTNEDTNDSSGITTQPSSSTGCIAVSKVSSTTEETPQPEKYSDLTFTPKKSVTLGKSHENNAEPSSSMPLLHDEDSMMRTLSNLKKIPDAISPLRSPIRITKRSHLHVHGKPGHVKSLQKEFSSTAIDANSKTLDVNKENKYPGSPAKKDTLNSVDSVSDQPSSLSDTELEEGEIISESDETAAGSPSPATKRTKLVQPVKNKASPKSLLMKKTKERYVATKETQETAGGSTRSPKSRFKTVCPAATKASFSTIEEVMETFKVVRTEIRKKYMKLHKTFPKKSFYGVMDNFQESFFEFVDGAHFGQICSQAGELKSKLKKLIASVFSKVSNNGIVKRIFDQQAVDLKQRLWDFVDVQVDYLFKDINTTLNSLCQPAGAQSEDSRPSGNEKASGQPTAKKPQCQQKKAQLPPTSLNQVKSSAVMPYRTGLGSRGKDIRIIHVEKDRTVDPHPTNFPKRQTPEKSNLSSLVVSQNVSLLDKTDFELLTEQQASSLTFNLVRDTQMGEIFKCLLQGSDLLENGGISGDNTAWSLSTPRKDGERLLSITTPTKFDSPSKLLSPTKYDTPSKLIATWSSISPRKMSPQSKAHIQLNPAIFDESCLLEVPIENRALLQSSLSSQRSYSILAEDLAVSLTIPSPLKSDSHLSFLQPSSIRVMSTPDSVISAHISEDALLDEEDASEQDIHLALDTDNSSCNSSSSEVLATPFVFKPDLPMQALVMEKSNDHFIVKIRPAATGADTTLTADDSLSRTLTEETLPHSENNAENNDGQEKPVLLARSQNGAPSNAVPPEKSLSGICQTATNAAIHLSQDESLTLTKDLSHKEDSQKLKKHPKNSLSENHLHHGAQSSDHFFGQISQAASREDIAVTAVGNSSQTHHREEDTATQQSPSKALKIICPQTVVSDKSPHHFTERHSLAEDINNIPQKDQRHCDKRRKRKSHQEKSQAKRFRKEEESTEEMVSNCKKVNSESRLSPTSLSPSSLYAKNVIRKKGEVVMAWTRDEDRAILIDLKTKGASRETFSALSEKLNKPSEQIAHRFYQLMKLFKKQEKMDT